MQLCKVQQKTLWVFRIFNFFNKIIKFNFIKIKYIEQYSSVSDKNDKFLDYINEKKKYEAIYNKILIEYNKWKLNYTYYSFYYQPRFLPKK